jgi:hypothetical protein
LFFVKDFLWTMDRDKNGHDGLNGQEWTAEWTMDNGRWTMDDGQRLCSFRANPNIADPTDLLDPADLTDPSEKTTAKTTNPRAISSVEATTPIKNFRVFSCGSWLKNGLWAPAHAKPFRAFRGQKWVCAFAYAVFQNLRVKIRRSSPVA